MTKRGYISQYIRYKVLKRCNFRCICGKRLKFSNKHDSFHDDTVVAHVDHIVPLSKGGADDITNMRALCGDCNLHKSAKMPDNTKYGGMTDLEIGNEIDKLKILVVNAKKNLNLYNIQTVKHWDYLRARLELFLPNKRRVVREEI